MIRDPKLQIILITAVSSVTVFVLPMMLKELVDIIFIGCMITALIIGVSYFVHRRYSPSIAVTKK
ncbi:MAG: hypothetical protein M3297_08635 [Thermoproteota archaeon]|nr:hypothetical protein [Thermoproteota archaeon]